MSKRNRINRVKNFNFNTSKIGASTNFGKYQANPEMVAKNLRNYISPVQLTRLRQDVASWRESIHETERAYYPFRVKMQRMFIDTILNGHVYGLMERRKDLTLLRKFEIQDKNGNNVEELTTYLADQKWFYDFLEYSLDALFFGYSLISLGDIENDSLKEISIIPRWFVSPDRHEVGSYIYSPSGVDFGEEPYCDWHVYVKTKSDNGVSPCGYGLLYNIALYEIFLRNTLGYNGDFVELFAMPYRVGKTTKTTETERAELESAVKNMGSAGYAIIDPMDEIEFLETKLAGTGYKSYESLEERCIKTVSKIILGHADAMDSTPGKLGAEQGGEKSPVQKALEDKQTKDGRFIEPVINEQLLPKLRLLGLTDIPEGYRFKFVNDGEEEEIRAREDQSNLVTSQIAQTMKNAGLQMDAKYFSDRTGIPAEKIEMPEPLAPGEKKNEEEPDDDDARSSAKVKNKLSELYK